MDDIYEIMDELKRRRLVTSKASFCRDFLGRTQPYLTAVRKVSADALRTLYQRLQRAGQPDLAMRVFLMLTKGQE